MPHPELEGVLRFGGLRYTADVRMQIDKPWHYIHSMGIDLACRILRTTIITNWCTWRAHATDFRNPVSFDDKVHWTLRRRAGSIDHYNTSYD
jgi:hypothetical protein